MSLYDHTGFDNLATEALLPAAVGYFQGISDYKLNTPLIGFSESQLNEFKMDTVTIQGINYYTTEIESDDTEI